MFYIIRFIFILLYGYLEYYEIYLFRKQRKIGVKQNSKDNREVWIGGKLHISVVFV